MTEKFLTEDEYIELKKLIKANKNKTIHRRLTTIQLWHEGYTYKEISKRTGYSTDQVVYQAIKRFKEQGLAEFSKLKYGNNNRNLTLQREQEILECFIEQAKKGVVVTVSTIKEAFDKELGRDTKHYVYDVLKRHEWRSVMPRPTHPHGVTDEEIEASKKLKLRLKM